MSSLANSVDINIAYCDIYSLKNYMIVAYPNFLVLGNPVNNNSDLKFHKNSYLKIPAAYFEQWYLEMDKCIKFFDDQSASAKQVKTIFEDRDFTYYWAGVTDIKNEKFVDISGGHESGTCVYFSFNKNEIENLLVGFSEILMKVFCLNVNVYRCFYFTLNNFLLTDYSNEEMKQIIANSDIEGFSDLCKKCCEKNNIQGDWFQFAEIVLRHKINLLIIYLIKKTMLKIDSILFHK